MTVIFEKNVAGKLRIEIESEEATSTNPARIRVSIGDKVSVEIVAKVERKQAADGGYYHCVTLERK